MKYSIDDVVMVYFDSDGWLEGRIVKSLNGSRSIEYYVSFRDVGMTLATYATEMVQIDIDHMVNL